MSNEPTDIRTLPDIDIRELVGEMPAKRCEEDLHEVNMFHADGGEQYVNWHGHKVIIFCAAYITFMTALGSMPVECKTCGGKAKLGELFTVLGPVTQ